MVFSDKQPSPTVRELAEARVLERIFPRLPHAEAALLGPGDDCAVLATPDGRTVVTTDMMVHGPDFRLAWSTAHDLGWKAAASNLSDVAAIGARPTALLIALAVPDSMPVAFLEEFCDGLRDGCAALAPGCGVIGGDLSVSATFTIAVTAFGDLAGRRPVLRSGASPGDVVAVSGDLGRSAEGLRLLFAEGVDENGEPDRQRAAALRSAHPHAIAGHLAPAPPIADGVRAADAGATAMMDISDGLALDASRLARASGVTIDLERAALGDDVAAALHGGEDHGLLASFPEGTALPGGFRHVGTVVSRSADAVLVDGEPVTPEGWDPYRAWDGQSG
ncbi:thiamine-phosphate kinase [Paramicrobacterium humi]|uniref:Thiamine-monophosphate kinase n=1 Tax=Paramicrobacterium humi TaxID=640635 RepID=A0A1H4TJK1_9MICO|nr:thiamine-phosphate kinase [Microbacterium humi]SEC56577.1 thiamine-phosphate kinase [Microbacterium humi]